MDQTKTVKLASGRKIVVRTWPIKPSLGYVNFAVEVFDSLAKSLGIQAVNLQTVSLPQLTVEQLLKAVQSICSADPDRLIRFIADGVELTLEECEQLSLAEGVELAWEVGQFNLRPIPGLFAQMKKSSAKSTPPPLN